jgi:hypothetical protein
MSADGPYLAPYRNLLGAERISVAKIFLLKDLSQLIAFLHSLEKSEKS